MKRSQWSYSTLSIALLVVCLVAVNVIFSFIPLRIDVTDDKLYTISEGTETILSDLEDTVTIKYYFSKNYAELPPQFKAYAQRIEELLREYAHLADGAVKLETFDPEPDSEEEEWAQKYGISQVRLPNGESFYLGMTALLLDQEVSIPFFDLRREKFLEYDISQAILSLNTTKSPKIGILTALNLRGGRPQMGRPQQPAGEWAMYSELKKNFDVEMLQPNIEEVPEAITLLVLMHPKRLSERTQYALDQYVLRGGRLIVLVDPNSNHEARTAPGPQMGRPPDAKSDLPKLLKNWGVEFDAGKLVGDFRYATQINAGRGEIVRYPVWMSLSSEALDAEHPITSQLETLLFADAGHLKKVKDSSVEFTPIIQTSPDSGTIDAMMVQFSQPAQITRDLKPDQESKVLAALVRDQFKTAFPEGRPPKPPKKEGDQSQEAADLPLKNAHLSQAEEPQTILVVADVDFVSDTFSVQKLDFLGQVVLQPLNDNLNFIFNAIETLSGNDALMSVRSRGRFSRPFTRVLALENQAQLRFQKEEATLQQSLQEVQAKLKNLQEKKDPQKKRLLTKEQQNEIRKFRAEELQTRKRLRLVRKSLRQDIETLGNRLLALNILLIPAIVGIVGIVSYRSRSRKRKK